MQELQPDEFKEPASSSQQADDNKTKATAIKHSSSQFFHFVRLMQLFPHVHPATLHTVMTLCKNDFFVAVDRLLYAKRCKEMYNTRKNVFGCNKSGNNSASTANNNNNGRCAPHPCNGAWGACNQTHSQSNVHAKPHQLIKLDAKKLMTRKANKCNGNGSNQQLPDTPFTLQCHVPLRPLSPLSPEDLSSSSHNPEV